MKSERRDPLKALVWPAYGTALAIVAVAAVDLVQVVWPLQPGEVGWRYGAAGFLSGSIVMPSVAALVLLSTAIRFEHIRTQYALALIAGVSTLLLLGALVVFAMDGLVMGARLQPNAANSFWVSQVKGLIRLSVGVLLAGVYAYFAFKNARAAGATHRAAAASDMLVATRSGSKAEASAAR